MSQLKHIPKDAQVIMSIIKDMGIVDYEPKVLNQLLEFTYRYITYILDDSRIYANHAKKKFIDLDDVTLAVKMQLERTFTNPPPRDVILDVARAKNNIPLPFVKPHNGLRLPPERCCLNATNYKLKTAARGSVRKGIHTFVGSGSLDGHSRLKVDGNKNGLSIVKKPVGNPNSIVKAQTIAVPKPLFKFSTSTSSVDSPITMAKPRTQIQNYQSVDVVKMEMDDSSKRKREPDDYDVL